MITTQTNNIIHNKHQYNIIREVQIIPIVPIVRILLKKYG